MSLNIAVIFGGSSPEHEVSLASARSVLDAFDPGSYTLTPVGISKSQKWLVGPGAWAELYRNANVRLLPAGLKRAEGRSAPAGNQFIRYGRLPPEAAFAGVDVLFPLVHGNGGEDGVLQGVCEAAGLPTIGCSLLASAVCFDKGQAKAVLTASGLPVCRGFIYTRRQIENDVEGVQHDARSRFGDGDLFTKPVRSGSSFGISHVPRGGDLRPALQEALRYDDRVLVEEYIDQRELVVGILGNDDLVISPPGECVPTQQVYSYEDKYIVGNPHFRCPAPLPEEMTQRVRSLAADAYRALGCTGFARVDCFLDKVTDKLFVNEVNTIPGLTTSSVYPKVMAQAGYTYARILSELAELAIDAHRRRWRQSSPESAD